MAPDVIVAGSKGIAPSSLSEMVTATGYFSPENSDLTPLQPHQWEALRRISSEMVTAQG
jgi:hypothetical protein